MARPDDLRVGELNRRRKLSNDAVREIRSSSDTPSALARRFGVSRTMICKVLSGENWGHVQ